MGVSGQTTTQQPSLWEKMHAAGSRAETAHTNAASYENRYREQGNEINTAATELRNNPELQASMRQLAENVKNNPRNAQKHISDWVVANFGQEGGMRGHLDRIANPILDRYHATESLRMIQHQEYMQVKDEWDAKLRNALYTAIITTVLDFITPDVLPIIGGFVEGGLDTLITGAVSLGFKIIAGEAKYDAPGFSEYAVVWLSETLLDFIPVLGDMANFGLSGFVNPAVIHFFVVQRERSRALKKAEKNLDLLN